MDAELQNLNHLRNTVSDKCGREIKSSNDCDFLAGEIAKLGISINPQTFRRFFNLVKWSGGFSPYTLNSLSSYSGFNDYTSFKNSLIENEMELLLGDINSTRSDDDYWSISASICQKISDSPAHLAILHHQLMKYPAARIFFMEHHPMRDLAGTVYSQYFQEYLKYKSCNEAKIYAYGFLYIGAFLTANSPFMEIYSQKVAESELSSEVYVLPAGRKFGVQLLNAWVNKEEERFTKIFTEMVTARQTYEEISQSSVCSFEYAVLEHLIFTDKTEEMRFLIDNNTSQLFSDRGFVRQHRKENHEECWKIMCAIAYLKMKEYELCENNLRAVNLEKLSLGWRKYYSILYYFAKYEFVEIEEKPEIEKRLNHLIEETHFVYYSDMLRNLRSSNPPSRN